MSCKTIDKGCAQHLVDRLSDEMDEILEKFVTDNIEIINQAGLPPCILTLQAFSINYLASAKALIQMYPALQSAVSYNHELIDKEMRKALGEDSRYVI
jgi:hypothetical protein